MPQMIAKLTQNQKFTLFSLSLSALALMVSTPLLAKSEPWRIDGKGVQNGFELTITNEKPVDTLSSGSFVLTSTINNLSPASISGGSFSIGPAILSPTDSGKPDVWVIQ